jgi:Ser/Thr protein kinase RdoA (MazF antagonist)
MEGLVGLGQRSGWSEVRQVVEDRALIEELQRYERFFPEEAHILRWHAERAHALFNEIDGELAGARRLVIHGDFAPWNLLYEDGQLTGILDFEAAHFDLAIADFALSWRGKYDGVIRGYEEVRPLTDLDWRSLTPVFWSWLLLGLAEDLRAINAGRAEPTLPDWSLRLLLRRSPLMASEAEPYPGLGGLTQ